MAIATGPQLPKELAESTAFLLKRLGATAKERSLAAYEKAGLHPSHHAVLAVLAEGERESQSEIADVLRYDRGQLVGLLDELEEQGLVERRRDPADRRRQSVRITAAGEQTLERLRALAAELEAELLDGLDAVERKQLFALLRRLAQRHLPRAAG
jgi:DNA-binding MarR family transcriptional regulator